ncbi:ABC transporter ATP-binding protein [Thauera sinica]|uniref:ABC transporter ATP-binding protein n=1 Tax=Thauera sinica TaxID=2665146 RepID=A0ABW1AMG9_9RHOO|nr:ABC transporter ATP-binding protein [Thauera sp. K11]ATE59169.1 multidrug ABC transporter [Thauera sp. K11]
MRPRHDVAPARIAGAAEHGEEIFERFDSRIAHRLWRFVRPHAAMLAATLASVLLFTAVQVAVPYTVRHAVDGALGRSAHDFGAVMVVFGVLAALYAVLQFLHEWLASRLAQRVIFDLRRAMYAHLQDVSLALLDQTQVGRLMARLQSDVGTLQEFLESSVSALGDLVLLAGIVVVLLSIDLRLGLMTLAVIPALIVLRVIWMPWAERRFRRAREASSSVNAALAENIGGIRTVQESRREAHNFERYAERARDNLEAQVGSARASQAMVPVVDLLTGVALAIVVLAGGSQVVAGGLGVGVLVAYIFYTQRFFDPIRTLSMQYTTMQRAAIAAQRIFEVLDLPVTISDRPDAIRLRDEPPSIVFDHVDFGYRPGLPVLHDLCLEVAPYTTVALVGPTGSGKTSITALVRRFYDVWSGSVRVGGHDVRDLAQDTLGANVAMVLQEPFLFSGSILDNIRYAVPHAGREEVIAAAKAVHAHDFILGLPEGYDTMLGQRGRNLSVGQRQLISFARALLAQPRILILDEATANIDSFTEQAIQRALKVLLAGRTCLVIAHRLATIRDADLIVVLDRGRIVEQGSHARLLARRGLYHRLHASGQGSFDDVAGTA